MAKQPNIGVVPIPKQFKYEQVIRRGKPVHDGDYFSIRHPLMEHGKRAKIFAPFAALKGFEEEVRSKEVKYEPRRLLDPDELYELNQTLQELHNLTYSSREVRLHPVIAEAEYFVLCEDSHHEAFHTKGQYVTVRDTVTLVDPITQTLKIGDLRIPFHDLFNVRIIPKHNNHQ